MYRFALCFFLLSVSGNAMAETYVSIAPFTVDANGMKNAPSDEMMQELVLSCLSKNDAFAVFERGDLSLLTKQEGKFMTGFSMSQSADMQLKHAQYIITGSIVALEGKWLIALQANDPATKQIIAASSALVNANFYRETDGFCTVAVSPLANKLLSHLAAPLGAGAAEDTQSEESTLLLKGIGYADNGDYAQAFRYFLKVLNRNPHNADARYWLAISYAKAGMSDFARSEAAQCFAEFPHHPKRKELELLLAPAANQEKPL